MEKPAFRLPPLTISVRALRVRRSARAFSRAEAGLSVYRRLDAWNDHGRFCITIDRVRRVISRNIMRLPARATL